MWDRSELGVSVGVPNPLQICFKLNPIYFHYFLPCNKSPQNLQDDNCHHFIFFTILCVDRAQLGVLPLHRASVDAYLSWDIPEGSLTCPELWGHS